MSEPVQLSTLINFLHQKHPNARYELDWETPEQLLVATILAAQCTDERVNKVTKTLFVKYPNPHAFAEAELSELEEDIKPTGFYKQKAKTLIAANKTLVQKFKGKIPQDIDKMTTIPGVARKSANVVLNTAFKMPSGIIVDTHCARVSQRMGLSKHDKPEAIETDLMHIVPKDQWVTFGPAMVLHGRYTCTSKAPKCGACDLESGCPKIGVSKLANLPFLLIYPVRTWVNLYQHKSVSSA
jgi:endonuclease III